MGFSERSGRKNKITMATKGRKIPIKNHFKKGLPMRSAKSAVIIGIDKNIDAANSEKNTSPI